MPQRIVLASANLGKAKEFAELLAGHNIRVVPQSDFGVPDVDETGLTFVENAIEPALVAELRDTIRRVAWGLGPPERLYGLWLHTLLADTHLASLFPAPQLPDDAAPQWYFERATAVAALFGDLPRWTRAQYRRWSLRWARSAKAMAHVG